MSLKDALAGIKEAQSPVASKSHIVTEPSAKPRDPAQTLAKSRDPDYEPVKLFLRIKTRRDAERKWEDANGGDFSDLVQRLLHEYLSA